VLNDQKILRAYSAGCEWGVNEDRKNEAENCAFAPCIEAIAERGRWVRGGRASSSPFRDRLSHDVRDAAQLRNSLGSVILPVRALAATVIGEARKTWDSL